MNLLIVTVDSAGALHPQIALARRLIARGHDVRFLACRSQRDAIVRAGCQVRTFTGAPDLDMSDPQRAVRDWEDSPEQVFATCCERIWFGPAASVAAETMAEIDRQPVDVVAVDFFAFGAAIAAERLALPLAVLWHTTYFESPAWDGAGLGLINAARAGVGLAPDPSIYSAYHRAGAILALTTAAFASDSPTPANLRYVGPQLLPGHEPPLARRTEQLPFVLVTLGTSYQAQEALLERLVTALGQLPVRALVTTGPAVSYPGHVPANVEIVPWLVHSEVLPQVDLIVSHAGLGTVMTAMAFGVPMLCVPLGRDQHGNASRVSALGFGVSLDAGATVGELAAAVAAALDDAGLRERARTLAADCAGGYDRAAAELERLAADHRTGSETCPS